MFPVEKPSMLNIKGGSWGNAYWKEVSMINLLNEQSLNKIAKSAGAQERLWKGFITFRSASAGVLTVFIIVQLIKLIIGTIIYRYAILFTDAVFIF